MSPEQAKGRDADKRSDVWAFGCVLYEMLTGRRAFASDNVQETLALVLTSEPDWARPAIRRARGRAPHCSRDASQRIRGNASPMSRWRSFCSRSGTPRSFQVKRRSAARSRDASALRGRLAWRRQYQSPVRWRRSIWSSRLSTFQAFGFQWRLRPMSRCWRVRRQRRSRIAGRTSRRPSCLSSGWRAGQTGHSSVRFRQLSGTARD